MTSKGATAEGTKQYKEKFSGTISSRHFRQRQGWWISSIGLGTYLGEADETTDRDYEAAVISAVKEGCNLLDTAINYRFQRSERNIGAALRSAAVSREGVVLSTKGGFISFDGGIPANPSCYFLDEFVKTGICKAEDLVAGCHCMSPEYLENQIERSLKNLNVDCLDIYLLHNPETQLSEISRQQFLKRILAAFKMLERKVADGKIQIYGVATWNGFRESPQSRSYLSLEELIGLARDAGGDDHHFRALQLPFNLAMPEAYLNKNQKLGSRSVSLLEAAGEQDMIVLCSASILQGQLAGNLPDFLRNFFSDLRTDAQRSIQFVRSTPGVTCALVGMSSPQHVEENLQLAATEPLNSKKMQELFEK